MEKYHIEVMLQEETVNRRIRELGEEISRDYEGKTVHLICILKGSVYFTCELAKRITVPVDNGFYAVFQLWGGNEIQRCRQDRKRSG